jgi:hypothetical protein
MKPQNIPKIKPKKRIHFFPKTKLGKISFWVVIIAFIGIYLNYWISMIRVDLNDPCNLDNSCTSPEGLGRDIMIVFSLTAMGCVIIGGIASFIAILKYKDHAVSLVISAFIGLMGIIFILGEFLVPH